MLETTNSLYFMILANALKIYLNRRINLQAIVPYFLYIPYHQRFPVSTKLPKCFFNCV